MNAIEINDLKRVYKTTIGLIRRKVKEVVAVDGISFNVREGELFGLLGPNGAGKTTTVKMLTTLLIPTGGSATIQGLNVVKDADKVRPRIGFIFGGERGLYWRLSGLDNLRYFSTLYYVDPDVSKKRIPELIEMVGLTGREKEKVEGYSRGMRQRLHIARALLHDPQVLFLDEPTIGLDPIGARELRAAVLNLQSAKKTILLTTHYMFEADALCQRIAVINQGKIVALDTPEKLKETVCDLSVVEIEVFGIPQEYVDKISQLDFVDSVAVENHDQRSVLLIHTPNGPEAIPLLVEQLSGLKLGKIVTRQPTLEDAYVRLVGGGGMTWDHFKKTVNVVTMAFEVEMRQNLTDGFVLFGILLQPLIIAFMALWMLKEKGPDYSIFVVVGSGMTGLWTTLLFQGGNSITGERWNGTLEPLVGSPSSLQVIVFGKVLANISQSLFSMVVCYSVISFVIGYPLVIADPLLFFISLGFSIFAYVCFGLLIASLFILIRDIGHMINTLEFPVYILCGFLFPITLLPGWTTPLSYLLSPYWAALALHGAASGSTTGAQIIGYWGLLLGFSVIYVAASRWLCRVIL